MPILSSSHVRLLWRGNQALSSFIETIQFSLAMIAIQLKVETPRALERSITRILQYFKNAHNPWNLFGLLHCPKSRGILSTSCYYRQIPPPMLTCGCIRFKLKYMHMRDLYRVLIWCIVRAMVSITLSLNHNCTIWCSGWYSGTKSITCVRSPTYEPWQRRNHNYSYPALSTCFLTLVKDHLHRAATYVLKTTAHSNSACRIYSRRMHTEF